MRKHKRAKLNIITSMAALTVCVLMLFAATYAWFSTSVTSGNNVIKSGAFAVNILSSDASDGTFVELTSESGLFSGVTLTPIDESDRAVRYIKVENTCEYAMRVDLQILKLTGENPLASYIDVYVKNNVAAGDIYTIDEADKTSPSPLSALAGSADATVVSTTIPAATKDENDQTVPATLIIAVGLRLDHSCTAEAANTEANFKIKVIATQEPTAANEDPEP